MYFLGKFRMENVAVLLVNKLLLALYYNRYSMKKQKENMKKEGAKKRSKRGRLISRQKCQQELRFKPHEPQLMRHKPLIKPSEG